jgi:hypothetical protein
MLLTLFAKYFYGEIKPKNKDLSSTQKNPDQNIKIN